MELVRHRIGNTIVTRVPENEGFGLSPARLFPDFDPAVFAANRDWLAPRFWDPGTDRIYSSFHSWLIRTPTATILLDTCAGNDKNRPNNARFHRLERPYLANLAKAGALPEEIDFVVCTHLHVDHCGWNTRLVDGKWIPTFPRARYVFSRHECMCCDTRTKPVRSDDINLGGFEDSVLPILDAGLADLTDGKHTVCDGVTVEPAPGHTEGNIMLRIRSGREEALFTGDIMHQPIQVVRPDWNSRFCELPDDARTTRRAVLQEIADRDVMVFPAHFGGSYCGRVRKAAAGYRFEFA